MTTVGIDVGGSGVKGAPVDLAAGDLAGERHRLETPRPADVTNVMAAVASVAEMVGPADHIGITFPGVILDGVVRTAANLHPSWIGAPGRELFAEAIGKPVTLLNDADAAGIAEVAFGAGKGHGGVIMLLTFGTGIGSALICDGRLVPNTELGHMEIRGQEAEHRASDHVREEKDLSWKKWAAAVDEYLLRLEALFSPNLFIVGGGVSRKHAKFVPLLTVRTPVVPASMLNEAGMVGAALAAQALVPPDARPSEEVRQAMKLG